jgi:predicted RNA-binding protein YlqC (UPF0109 family)
MPSTAISPQKNESDSIEELKNILTTITRGIVDEPDEIVIFPAPGEGFVHFEVRCDNKDTGSLIGRRGAHADAIRTLIMAAGAVRKIRVTMQILSREGDKFSSR